MRGQYIVLSSPDLSNQPTMHAARMPHFTIFCTLETFSFSFLLQYGSFPENLKLLPAVFRLTPSWRKWYQPDPFSPPSLIPTKKPFIKFSQYPSASYLIYILYLHQAQYRARWDHRLTASVLFLRRFFYFVLLRLIFSLFCSFIANSYTSPSSTPRGPSW